MGQWNRTAVILTVIGMLLVATVGATLGLYWGMFVEMTAIISIIIVQNLLVIVVCWFASRNQYSQLRWWLTGYWGLMSFSLAGLFLLAAFLNSLWWWLATATALILTEVVMILLAFYIKSEPNT